jgi:DNA-binding CsgD family transcriptional regulator
MTRPDLSGECTLRSSVRDPSARRTVVRSARSACPYGVVRASCVMFLLARRGVDIDGVKAPNVAWWASATRSQPSPMPTPPPLTDRQPICVVVTIQFDDGSSSVVGTVLTHDGDLPTAHEHGPITANVLPASRSPLRTHQPTATGAPDYGEPAGPTCWRELTRGQRAVAILAAAAFTNREIATRLFISPHTVNYHLRQIFQRLKINSRVELAKHLWSQPEEGLAAGCGLASSRIAGSRQV